MEAYHISRLNFVDKSIFLLGFITDVYTVIITTVENVLNKKKKIKRSYLNKK